MALIINGYSLRVNVLAEFIEVPITGFELGADLAANVDIDDYYVYDRNPRRITELFADILFRHLDAELGDYLATNYGINNGQTFINQFFVTGEIFQELVRSAEGVIRDLINIFTQAVLDAFRRQRGSIDRRAVLQAARQWYETDKVKELGDDLQSVLQKIINDVIGERRARAFLVSRELQRHPVIHRLVDARVLHLMVRGYADKDNPGVRYNIYSIDYGAYVDLLNTSKAPHIEFEENSSGPEIVVPFDDKRSIRRIILPADILGAA